MCRSKDRDTKKKVHEVNDLFPDQYDSNSDSDNERHFFVDGIQLDKGKSQAFATVAVGPNNTALKFKIDSGAQVNIIPKSLYKSLGVKGPLVDTKQSLTAYDGSKLGMGSTTEIDSRLVENRTSRLVDRTEYKLIF